MAEPSLTAQALAILNTNDAFSRARIMVLGNEQAKFYLNAKERCNRTELALAVAIKEAKSPGRSEQHDIMLASAMNQHDEAQKHFVEMRGLLINRSDFSDLFEYWQNRNPGATVEQLLETLFASRT